MTSAATLERRPRQEPEPRQAPPGAPGHLTEIPLRRLGRPEDIADACVFLASDASAYVTGDMDVFGMKEMQKCQRPRGGYRPVPVTP